MAVIRLEQLYPFPQEALLRILDRYSNAKDLVWPQEEPENMGAWSFVQSHLRRVLPDTPITPVAREESGSPASGSQTVHDKEQDELLAAAITEPI